MDKANKDLGSFALPSNLNVIPVYPHDFDTDTFLPYAVCPMIDGVRADREKSPEHKAFMDEKYSKTIKALAIALHFDPKTFSSLDAVQYTDSLWARYFDQYPMPGFNDALLSDMMLLYNEYYNWTLAMDETVRKVFVTGVFGEVVDLFDKTVR